MKGKGTYRFNLPNVSRLRSRVSEPSSELTSQIREKLQEIACRQLNAAQLSIKAELINYVVTDLGLEFKTPANEAQVKDLTNSIFDSFFAPTPEALAEITGEEIKSDDEKSEPKAEPKQAKAKAKAEPKQAKAKETDEFEE